MSYLDATPLAIALRELPHEFEIRHRPKKASRTSTAPATRSLGRSA